MALLPAYFSPLGCDIGIIGIAASSLVSALLPLGEALILEVIFGLYCLGKVCEATSKRLGRCGCCAGCERGRQGFRLALLLQEQQWDVLVFTLCLLGLGLWLCDRSAKTPWCPG